MANPDIQMFLENFRRRILGDSEDSEEFDRINHVNCFISLKLIFNALKVRLIKQI